MLFLFKLDKTASKTKMEMVELEAIFVMNWTYRANDRAVDHKNLKMRTCKFFLIMIPTPIPFN